MTIQWQQSYISATEWFAELDGSHEMRVRMISGGLYYVTVLGEKLVAPSNSLEQAKLRAETAARIKLQNMLRRLE